MSFQAIDCFLLWDSLCFGCKKKMPEMPDKYIVFGCSNRPNKKKGIFFYPFSFYGTDDMEKHKRRKKWVNFVELKHAQWNPWNTLRCVQNMSQKKITLLCFLVWLRLILEGWSWDFDPCNLYFCRNKPAEEHFWGYSNRHLNINLLCDNSFH